MRFALIQSSYPFAVLCALCALAFLLLRFAISGLSVPNAPGSPRLLSAMLNTHAVGIDLGTTYSCIAYLNEHGEPVTLPNQEGELSTPSVVLFDDHDVVVGTEAQRNAILRPDRVVANAKRYIGDASHKWFIGGKAYSPVDISSYVLKKLISAAQEQIGPIEQAVITVPAQFSDAQRHATMEAGHRAGLQRVDIINEPVAAALCYVLGTEGLWFTELAGEQKIMVYDLGGGTFDLSLVRYQQNEVSVLASSGDLHLGGIDWNDALLQAIAAQFAKEFGVDPRTDPSSLQALVLEAEQTKRSLTVRPRAAMTVQHAGHRKTYQVEQAQFEKLSRSLVDKTCDITQRMLKDNKIGWAHVDVVLTTGGASRMPMIRDAMKKLSGRTLNTSLSPDLSIAHGATYYAGMLLTNNKFAKSILNEKAHERLSQVKQKSVNARALGILVRDMETNTRVPHYLVQANTQLPTEATQHFGTVAKGQKRVHLQIVESGITPEKPPTVLGSCVIDGLPPDLPEGSEIAVTIHYDEQARVHVSAKDVASGKKATAELIRSESLVPQLASDHSKQDENAVKPVGVPKRPSGAPSIPASAPTTIAGRPAPSVAPPSVVRKTGRGESPANVAAPAPRPPAATPPSAPPSVRPAPRPRAVPAPSALGSRSMKDVEDADKPVPLCNTCGEPLDARGVCKTCAPSARPTARPQPASVKGPAGAGAKPSARPTAPSGAGGATVAKPAQRPAPKPAARPGSIPLPSADEIFELDGTSRQDDFHSILDQAPAAPPAKPSARPAPRPTAKPAASAGAGAGNATAGAKKPAKKKAEGEDEFWEMVDE